MLDEERDEADVGVQRVEALGPDQRRGGVALLAEGSERKKGGRMEDTVHQRPFIGWPFVPEETYPISETTPLTILSSISFTLLVHRYIYPISDFTQ